MSVSTKGKGKTPCTQSSSSTSARPRRTCAYRKGSFSTPRAGAALGNPRPRCALSAEQCARDNSTWYLRHLSAHAGCPARAWRSAAAVATSVTIVHSPNSPTRRISLQYLQLSARREPIYTTKKRTSREDNTPETEMTTVEASSATNKSVSGEFHIARWVQHLDNRHYRVLRIKIKNRNIFDSLIINWIKYHTYIQVLWNEPVSTVLLSWVINTSTIWYLHTLSKSLYLELNYSYNTIFNSMFKKKKNKVKL